MPMDLIALDWQPFLGKSLGRGFSQPDMIKRSAGAFIDQFARWVPSDVVASVLGLYAHATGELDNALDYLTTALSEQPENPLWLKRAALARLAVDAADTQAPEMLELAAEIGGAGSLYAAQLADYQWSNRQRPRAIRTMRTLCDAGTPIPELPYIAARMMRQSRQSDDGTLGYIDLALKATPHVRRFMSLRAHILFDMQDTVGGTDAVDQIVARFGDAGDVSTLRARQLETT
jgi:hypothetical protein